MSPTGRALMALELMQNCPGITAVRLGERLGVTERAARRYVAILREADIPIESVSGPHGGYRVGRGLRLAPLMFTAPEALGLVMAVLEGHRGAADPADLVGGALAKIVRALPARVADPARRAVVAGRPPATAVASPPVEIVARLLEACSAARRVRLAYRTRPDVHRAMEVDPWAVVLRHSRWYLLCWSHTRDAQRVLRLDRVAAVETLPATFTPPPGLDARAVLEDHLSRGWTYPVDVLIAASAEEVAGWLPRSLGRLEPAGDEVRLVATTDEPQWYARQLATVPAPFRVVGSPQLRQAVADLAHRLTAAAS